MQDVKLELVKLKGNPDPEMGEGLKTQIWWIDRKELANTFTC